MKKAKHIFFLFYKHSFIRYLFVGGTTFIIDETILVVLNESQVWLPLALFISYLVAFIYNFSLNRWWAFSASENSSLRNHMKPYCLLFFFNLLFTILFVSLGTHFLSKVIDRSVAVPLAKALAVIIQMTWTYYIYKNVIFTKKGHTSTSESMKATISTI